MPDHTKNTWSNPYVGLRPFEEGDSPVFCGRGKQIHAILHRLYYDRVVVITGNSGCGKSSLVAAGIVPAFRKGQDISSAQTGQDDSNIDRLSVASHALLVRPGDSPIEALSVQLSLLWEQNGRSGERLENTVAARIAQYLSYGPSGLSRALNLAKDQLSHPTESQPNVPVHHRFLLVVDQFEELFAHLGMQPGRKETNTSPHATQRHRECWQFIELIFATLERHPEFHVIFTMRAEFVGLFHGFPGLPQRLEKAIYLCPSMSRQELEIAIYAPARLAGLEVSPEFTDALLNDFYGQETELGVLQHALFRSTQLAIEQCASAECIVELRHYSDEAVGRIENALNRHIHQVYELLTEKERHVFEELFRASCQWTASWILVRRTITIRQLPELCDSNTLDDQVEHVLKLVTQPANGFFKRVGELIEVQHECILRRWTRMFPQPGERIQTRSNGTGFSPPSNGPIERSWSKIKSFILSSKDFILYPILVWLPAPGHRNIRYIGVHERERRRMWNMLVRDARLHATEKAVELYRGVDLRSIRAEFDPLPSEVWVKLNTIQTNSFPHDDEAAGQMRLVNAFLRKSKWSETIPRSVLVILMAVCVWLLITRWELYGVIKASKADAETAKTTVQELNLSKDELESILIGSRDELKHLAGEKEVLKGDLEVQTKVLDDLNVKLNTIKLATDAALDATLSIYNTALSHSFELSPQLCVELAKLTSEPGLSDILNDEELNTKKQIEVEIRAAMLKWLAGDPNSAIQLFEHSFSKRGQVIAKITGDRETRFNEWIAFTELTRAYTWKAYSIGRSEQKMANSSGLVGDTSYSLLLAEDSRKIDEICRVYREVRESWLPLVDAHSACCTNDKWIDVMLFLARVPASQIDDVQGLRQEIEGVEEYVSNSAALMDDFNESKLAIDQLRLLAMIDLASAELAIREADLTKDNEVRNAKFRLALSEFEKSVVHLEEAIRIFKSKSLEPYLYAGEGVNSEMLQREVDGLWRRFVLALDLKSSTILPDEAGRVEAVVLWNSALSYCTSRCESFRDFGRKHPYYEEGILSIGLDSAETLLISSRLATGLYDRKLLTEEQWKLGCSKLLEQMFTVFEGRQIMYESIGGAKSLKLSLQNKKLNQSYKLLFDPKNGRAANAVEAVDRVTKSYRNRLLMQWDDVNSYTSPPRSE